MDLRRVRVLLIDDDEDDFVLTRSLLRRAGGTEFSLQWVDNYADGLEAIRRGRHDVVLVDYRLNGPTGLDVLREVREAGGHVPVILLTGQGDADVDLLAMHAGAADYLVKGEINAPLLERSIRYALERAEAADALRRSEERIRSLIQDLDAVVWEADAENWQFTFVSQRAEELLGYPVEQWLEVPDFWVRHLYPEDREDAIAVCREAIRRGEDHAFEYRALAADGRVVWLRELVRVLPGEAGKRRRLRGLTLDITERVRAEETLRATRDRLQALFEAAPLAIFTLDPRGHVTSWNRASELMFGWTEAEVMDCFLPTVPEELVDEHHEICRQVLDGERVTGFVTERRRRDGTLIRVSVSVAPLHGPDGRANGIMTLVADETERKRLEEQVRQSQKMEAVGRLAGGVAHDFNNILAVINGYTELLLDRSLDDFTVTALREVHSAGQRAAGLTRQLLAFSRKQVVAPKVLDLNEVVTRMGKLLRPLIGEDIRLVTHLRPDLGRVEADVTQMEQMLLNLAVNARDAMPTGGILTIETRNEDQDLAVVGSHGSGKPGRYVLLTVRDTGLGMDDRTRSHIFEPFFTTKDPGKGTGLGLATVYGIVRQSGGYVNVQSEPGEGAVFQVYLPRVDRELHVEPQRPAEPTQGGSETVLVVEDEPSVREMVRQSLASGGYKVLSAGNAAEALDQYGQNPNIQLLLTDVVMPGLSGRELAEQILAQDARVRVLFMSGHTDDAIVRHGVLERGMAFLQKPFTPKELLRKVREVLD